MKSKRSTVFLIVCLLVAIALAGGLYYLLQKTDFSFLTQAEAAAESTPIATVEVTPTPEPTEEPAPKEVVISMIGDCTLASSQYDNSFDDFLSKNGMSWTFSGTVDYFQKDIFTLANLECTFSDQELGSASLFYFRAPTASTAILNEGNVDCVTLGNNHTNDFGEQGLLDTEAALDSAGVNWVGPNDAKVFDTDVGVKIGVAPDQVAPLDLAVRGDRADVAAVVVHKAVIHHLQPQVGGQLYGLVVVGAAVGGASDDAPRRQRDHAGEHNDQQSDCPWKASLSVPFHGILQYRFIFRARQQMLISLVCHTKCYYNR